MESSFDQESKPFFFFFFDSIRVMGGFRIRSLVCFIFLLICLSGTNRFGFYFYVFM